MVHYLKTKKTSQKGIPEQFELFQAIAKLGNDGILVLDEHNRIEFANGMVSHITGYKMDKLLGQNFILLLDGKNKKFFQTIQNKSHEFDTKTCQEIEIITATSEPVLTEMCIVNTFMQSGEKKYFVYLKDISSSKKLENKLRESERKYRNLFERVDQGIYISTKEGRFLDCNSALLKIMGYESKDEFLKMDIVTDLYVNPDDRREFQKLIERDGYVINYEVEYKKKHGEHIPVLLTSHVRLNEKGEVIGYQGLIVDISERIQMEQELQEKHSFLSNLLESSPDCIIAADMKGKVIFFNKAAEKLTGYKVDEVIGKFRVPEFYPLEVARDIMRRLRSDDFGGRGKLENFRLTFYGKNREEIPVSLSASIVYEGTKEVASLGVFTDQRDKIKMEKELQNTQMRLLQAEKMASLGSLAAGVAHEINNPLGGILIYASLLMEEFDADDDPRVQDLKKIVEEGTRCKEIVKSLLEFGRQTETKFELLNINQAINDGLFFLEHQALFHNIQIVKHLDLSLPLIQGNPNQIKQVFMNMMVNAAEAMSEIGGTLTIATGMNPDALSIFISFQDTGIGISSDNQSKIFDPFFTTKGVGRGTGLGLSTSYGIIQSHHGNIDVKSELNKGTTFIISLPIVAREIQ